MALCSTSRQSKSVWVSSSRKPGVTLKHPDRRNQVRHTGGTFTIKISVVKTKAGYRVICLPIFPQNLGNY